MAVRKVKELQPEQSPAIQGPPGDPVEMEHKEIPGKTVVRPVETRLDDGTLRVDF